MKSPGPNGPGLFIAWRSLMMRHVLRESGDELLSNSFCATLYIMYYVYVLQRRDDGMLYIGYTQDLRKRVKEHKGGNGSRTTNRGTWMLIYYEAYRNKMDALGREKFLKGGSGRKYLHKQLRYYWGKLSDA
jgi:putative endonuclease